MTKITWSIISLFRKDQNFSFRSHTDSGHHLIYSLFNRIIRHALCERHQDLCLCCSVNKSSQSAFQMQIWDDWSRRFMIFEHEDQSSQWFNYTDFCQIRQKSSNQTRHERMFFRTHINDWNQTSKIIFQSCMWQKEAKRISNVVERINASDDANSIEYCILRVTIDSIHDQSANEHWITLKRVLRYLQDIKNLRICYQSVKQLIIEIWSDSS